MVQCKNCGTHLMSDDNFCRKCGTPVPSRCKYCKEELKPGAKFCSYCGKPVEAENNTESIETQSEEEAFEEEIFEEVKSEKVKEEKEGIGWTILGVVVVILEYLFKGIVMLGQLLVSIAGVLLPFAASTVGIALEILIVVLLLAICF